MMTRTQLRQRIFSRSGTGVLAAAIVLIAVGAATFATHHAGNTAGHGTNAAKISSQSAGTAHTAGSNASNVSGAAGNTSDADKQTALAATAQPVTEACSLLTLGAARQLLGSAATAATPGDTSSLQATGTALSTCAYGSGSSNVQLVIRTPTGSLGRSENATMFGSGKPSDAVSFSGYGQSAYWNPGDHTFNVLGSNNWYIITRGSGGTQADAEVVAALLKSGF
jgi:hypothetical protein